MPGRGKNGQKMSKTGKKWHFSCFFVHVRLCLEDIVVEGDEIMGRRPVHYERRAYAQKGQKMVKNWSKMSFFARFRQFLEKLSADVNNIW